MAQKQLMFGSEAHVHMRSWVRRLADAVKCTMGPRAGTW